MYLGSWSIPRGHFAVEGILIKIQLLTGSTQSALSSDRFSLCQRRENICGSLGLLLPREASLPNLWQPWYFQISQLQSFIATSIYIPFAIGLDPMPGLVLTSRAGATG